MSLEEILRTILLLVWIVFVHRENLKMRKDIVRLKSRIKTLETIIMFEITIEHEMALLYLYDDDIFNHAVDTWAQDQVESEIELFNEAMDNLSEETLEETYNLTGGKKKREYPY